MAPPRPQSSLPSSSRERWEARARQSQPARLTKQDTTIISAADDPSVSQLVFTITEKAPSRTFSWLKAPNSAFTFKTLLRHYAKLLSGH